MPAEIEAKFLADGPEPLDELARLPALGPATLGRTREVREVDRYLDTPDGRLERERWACRLRERSGEHRISLKGPREQPGDGWLHRRPELEGAATGSLDPAAWPRSEARELLDRMRDGMPLVERFSLVQRRRERAALLDGRRLATLSLDEVAVRGPDGGEAGRLHAIELELIAGAGDADVADLGALAAELARREGLRPDGLAKLEHALELLGSR